MLTTILSASLALTLVISGKSSAIGASGWYATRIRVEYQYTDYNSYRYPPLIPPEYPESEYRQPEPYVADFPEVRTLVRITQSFGPRTALQLRCQHSDMSCEKNQGLYYAEIARDITDMTSVYGAYHNLSQPGYLEGYMLMGGLRHDRAGWILAESRLSYIRNRSSDGNLITTIAPLLSARYSLSPVSAVQLKWEGFWASGEKGSSTSHICTLFLSRHLPTQTALHLSGRYYANDIGVWSFAPGLEIAQYIRWNLTLRLSYRYYLNRLEAAEVAETIEGDSINSHSARAFLEWQIGSDLKLHLKLRRYISNQHIRMNTYLLGFEYLI